MKRTTLKLNRRTLAEVKRIASQEKRTISNLVDELLQVGVAGRRKTNKNGQKTPNRSLKNGRSRAKIAVRNPKSHVAENHRIGRSGEILAVQTLPLEDFSDWE